MCSRGSQKAAGSELGEAEASSLTVRSTRTRPARPTRPKSSHPDYAQLLTDIRLRDADGLELLASASSRPPVAIAVTKFDDETVRERALSAGFDLYLPKPGDPRALAQEIARRVGSR